MISVSGAQEDLLAACVRVFGDQAKIDGPFLQYIQLDGLKSAFRHRAKLQHPDGLMGDQESFICLRQDYEMLAEFISGRDSMSGAQAVGRQPRTARPRPETRMKPQPAEKSAAASLPRSQLRLGQYCYYSGLITWNQLIEALSWQRSARPSFGALARQLGYIRPADVERLLKLRRPGETLGRCARRNAILSSHQVQVILDLQSTYRAKLGSYFTSKKILSYGQLTAALTQVELHNQKLRQTSAGKAKKYSP